MLFLLVVIFGITISLIVVLSRRRKEGRKYWQHVSHRPLGEEAAGKLAVIADHATNDDVSTCKQHVHRPSGLHFPLTLQQPRPAHPRQARQVDAESSGSCSCGM